MKLLFIAFGLFVIFAIGYAGYLTGYSIAKQEDKLSNDNAEFLHGYKLDLPEEITAMDTTYILSVKDTVNKVIHQSIIMQVEYGVNDINDLQPFTPPKNIIYESN